MARVLNLVAAAALLSGQALGASHHAHKREVENVVVTVQKVSVVTVTAGAENAAAASVETSVSSVATVVAANEASSVVAAASSSAAAAAAASSSSSSSSGTVSVGSGGALGITYSPYTSSGACKTQEQVTADLAQLTGFSIIRLYGVDCDQVNLVNKAKAADQKLFLGIYYMNAITSGIQTMATALGNDWSDVHTVSIGNELVNNGEATVSQIASYVSEGRTALTAAGYTGPVVSVDTFIATINNPGLCSISDYTAVNAHAFFDGGIAAADAGTWVSQQITRVKNVCGKDTLIVESGWPSKGDTNGVAIPSEANQAAAISGIKSSAGSQTFLFNAYNDLWKADGSYNAEKYWGVYGSSSS